MWLVNWPFLSYFNCFYRPTSIVPVLMQQCRNVWLPDESPTSIGVCCTISANSVYWKFCNFPKTEIHSHKKKNRLNSHSLLRHTKGGKRVISYGDVPLWPHLSVLLYFLMVLKHQMWFIELNFPIGWLCFYECLEL